jgi:hypothetical protein
MFKLNDETSEGDDKEIDHHDSLTRFKTKSFVKDSYDDIESGNGTFEFENDF